MLNVEALRPAKVVADRQATTSAGFGLGGRNRLMCGHVCADDESRNEDGSGARYLQLAHNERNERGVPVARVIHSFGREDELDREALARLVGSIQRFLGVEETLRASAPEGFRFLGAAGGRRPARAGCAVGRARDREGDQPRSRAAAARRRGSSGRCSRWSASAASSRRSKLEAAVAGPRCRRARVEQVSRRRAVPGDGLPARLRRAGAGVGVLLGREPVEPRGRRDLLRHDLDLLRGRPRRGEPTRSGRRSGCGGSATRAPARPAAGRDRPRGHPGRDPGQGVGVARQHDDQTLVEQVKDDLAGWRLGRAIYVVDSGFSSQDNLRSAAHRRRPLHRRAMKLRSGMPETSRRCPGRAATAPSATTCASRRSGSATGDAAVRYVVCHNPAEAERDQARRANSSSTGSRRSSPRLAKQRQAAKSKPDREAHLRGECALRDHPTLARYLRQTKPGRLTVDHDKIAGEERLDGKYLLTAAPTPTLGPRTIALGYKQLIEAERGVRDLKGTLLLRPVSTAATTASAPTSSSASSPSSSSASPRPNRRDLAHHPRRAPTHPPRRVRRLRRTRPPTHRDHPSTTRDPPRAQDQRPAPVPRDQPRHSRVGTTRQTPDCRKPARQAASRAPLTYELSNSRAADSPKPNRHLHAGSTRRSSVSHQPNRPSSSSPPN